MKRVTAQGHAPIGIMDSGIGGLTIWREIRRQFPHESTIYLGDHANRPYGKKSAQQIRDRVVRVIAFLIGKGAKLIVVACNTATVAGIDLYRRQFPNVPIVGVVPVIKTAVQLTRTGCFAVLSTPFTQKSRYQRWLIQTFAGRYRVTNVGCPDLGTMIEEGANDKQVKNLLTGILRSFPSQRIDVIVLGCTHYPFVIDTIRDVVGDDVVIIDSSGAVARQVGRILDSEALRSQGRKPYTEFYTTEDALRVSRVATKLLGTRVRFAYARV